MHMHSKLAGKLQVALAPPTVPVGVSGGQALHPGMPPPPPQQHPGDWTVAHLKAAHIQEVTHSSHVPVWVTV